MVKLNAVCSYLEFALICKVPLTTIVLAERTFAVVFEIVRLLNDVLVVKISWVVVPLKFTVLPVVVSTPVAGV